ncbi:TetR/AcrR family transcriptional regulator [Paludibacterium purpuratum]|uniref:TetR family transcriptional regulator n=1 Tax=Paludibacterium purpuratum TaxID=1144873 RepID=A0A4R7BDX8_9NEIS|nr:TetR/AcrR family transcriptional regulator [Paludibacterium purpuratum]TDR82963.1 TetR family transcriptional regulator [Paludibacterium purpuratum]
MATTPITPEQERAGKRRNQVLEAAARSFRQHGFHGCSMAQLAKEAGMSVGHIYHYFENKEAIIDAIVQQDLDEWLASIQHLLNSSNIFEDMLAQLDDPVRDWLDADYAALQIEILAEAGRNAKVAAIVRASHEKVRDTISELLRKGSPRPLTQAEIDSKFDLIGALCDGLMARAIHSGTIDRERLLAMLRPTIRFILEY